MMQGMLINKSYQKISCSKLASIVVGMMTLCWVPRGNDDMLQNIQRTLPHFRDISM
jgi:hypothetical protein